MRVESSGLTQPVIEAVRSIAGEPRVWRLKETAEEHTEGLAELQRKRARVCAGGRARGAAESRPCGEGSGE